MSPKQNRLTSRTDRARTTRALLAQWYCEYLNPLADFTERVVPCGTLHWLVLHAFADSVSKRRDQAWLGAAVACIAALYGEDAAMDLVEQMRRYERDAVIESYGLAWISAGNGELVIEPVVAELATLGLGNRSRKNGVLPIYAWLRGKAQSLGLHEVAPPTRPFAIARITMRLVGVQNVVAARRMVHNAIVALLTHREAFQGMPGYMGRRSDDPVLGLPAKRGQRKVSWEDNLTAFKVWNEKHPFRRPPHGTPLANWVDDQRKLYRTGQLQAGREQRLLNAGFSFKGHPRPSELERHWSTTNSRTYVAACASL